jgi:hypothetical protein
VGKGARVRENQVVVDVCADDEDAQGIVAVFMDTVFRCYACSLRCEHIQGGCRGLFVTVVIRFYLDVDALV